MKSLDRRLYEVLADIPRLLGPAFGARAKELQMALIQKINDLSGTEVRFISAQLTLTGAAAAGVHTRLPFHTDHRQMARILVLLEAAFPSGHSKARIRDGKNNLAGFSGYGYGDKASLLDQLKKYSGVADTAIAGGGFVYVGKNQAHEQMVETGYSDAKALLTVIRARLKDSNDSNIAQLVDCWFGGKSEEIAQKIERLFFAINLIKIHLNDTARANAFGSIVGNMSSPTWCSLPRTTRSVRRPLRVLSPTWSAGSHRTSSVTTAPTCAVN